MDAAAELGRNPVSKRQIQPEYGDEQADAGRDCRTHFARPNSQARTGTGKYAFFAVQLTIININSRTGNLTRLILSLAICDDYTYIDYIDTAISSLYIFRCTSNQVRLLALTSYTTTFLCIVMKYC